MFLHQIAHLFYEPNMQPQGITLLNEEESGHIIKALRKRIGDLLHTTDGLGNLYEVEILELQKRQVALKTVKIFKEQAHPNPEVHIAIAPLKQMDRFEWFLEKAVEIGVTSITPIVTKRTERTVLKPERLQKIMVSAMKPIDSFRSLSEKYGSKATYKNDGMVRRRRGGKFAEGAKNGIKQCKINTNTHWP
jgi:RsmE family RNA methyltransferase